MSRSDAHDPDAAAAKPAVPADGNPLIDTVILPRARDLGGFEVRRALPSARRQMVGPFIFFDQMGPSEFILHQGIDVRPHPHIGLSTVTYLFDGEIFHRDTLGSALSIRPGEVNWMTAGRGIAHSERTSPEKRASGQRLFGIQSWVALPKSAEEREPGFWHHGAGALPVVEGEGAELRLIAGEGFGACSPVVTSSAMIYADIQLAHDGVQVQIPADYEERALYPVGGEIEVGGDRFGPHQLLVLHPGDPVVVTARGGPARLMLLGGDPMDGPRYIWWNFVSSSKDRIEQAKADWRAGRFGAVPGDDQEFIPLPEG